MSHAWLHNRILVGGVSVLMFASLVHHRLDSEMPEGVEIMNSTLLFLRPLQRNDSGVYRCEVANDINLRSRDVRILIQGEQSTHTRTQLTPIACSSPRKHCACTHVIVDIGASDIVLQAEMWHCITLAHSVCTDSVRPWYSVLALIIFDPFI